MGNWQSLLEVNLYMCVCTLFKRRQVASIGPNVGRSVSVCVEIFQNQLNQTIKTLLII